MGDEFEDAVLDALIKRSRKTAAKTMYFMAK